MSDIDVDLDWFHGNLRREYCEVVMAPLEPGKFLVRNSQATNGCFVLSVCTGSVENVKVDHFLIRIMRISGYPPLLSITDDMQFETLQQLVDFLNHFDTVIKQPLNKPVSRSLSSRFRVNEGAEDYQNLSFSATRPLVVAARSDTAKCKSTQADKPQEAVYFS